MKQNKKSKLVFLEKLVVKRGEGNAWIATLPDNLPVGDSMQNPQHSLVHLFEDGIELGPPHTIYDTIQKEGAGRYCHWGNKLFFSSSDNTSPKKNKRKYHILYPAEMFLPNIDPISASLLTFQIDTLPLYSKYELAKSFFYKIWRKTPLPDWGRNIERDISFEQDFYKISPDSNLTIERKYNLNQLFQLATKVKGDVAECGTYKGASSYFLAKHIINEKLDKKLCLFDSFKGLSQPEEIDGEYWSSSDLNCTVHDLQNTLSNLGNIDFVEIYDGWIPDKFNEISNRTFCFVHIDVDLYQPTLDSIEFFYPRVSPGGIIIFDDYGFETCPGATESIDNFMADKPESIVNLASGGAFIIKNSLNL